MSDAPQELITTPASAIPSTQASTLPDAFQASPTYPAELITKFTNEIIADRYGTEVAERSLPFSERRQILGEARDRVDGLEPSVGDRFVSDDGIPIGLEDLSKVDRVDRSDYARQVNLACDSIGIKEIYDRLSKGKYANETGDELQISCPNPEHPDEHPSASMNVSKGLFTCYRCCAPGTDKYAIAAYAWSYPVPIGTGPNFWEIKKRLAKELRELDYERDAPEPPASPADGDPDPQQGLWEKDVEEQKRKTLIRLEGDYRARQQRSAGQFTPPTFVSDLETELSEPDPVVEWTIDGLHSVGGNTTITAGFKVGKTTFVMNLIKALVDQEAFLGEHQVRSLAGRVALWNFEVEEVQMRRTFREMGIKKSSNIWHLPLRGHGMNLMDDAAYAWALGEMKRQEIEVWILDPFSGAYYGDENDNSQINAFTKRLDEFKREARIKDLFIPVHTGRYVEEGNERARGGAKLDDWTDNRWVLAKHSETGDRYFKAEGRRVEMAEHELQFRRDDSSLTYSAFHGTRKQKAGHVVRGDVIAFIESHPGCSGRDIEAGISGKSDFIRMTVKKLIGDSDVETRAGARNAKLHYRHGAAPPETSL